jgi:hypothetical protein
MKFLIFWSLILGGLLCGCNKSVMTQEINFASVGNLLGSLNVRSLTCSIHAVPEYGHMVVFIRTENSSDEFDHWKNHNNLTEIPAGVASIEVMPRVLGVDESNAPWWSPPSPGQSTEYTGKIKEYSVRALYDKGVVYIHAFDKQ